MNSSGVEDHTLEGAVLNVLVVVGHMNLPLSRLIRLEGGVEGAVVLRDRAAKWAVGRRVGGHLQQVRSGRVVRVDQHLQRRLSVQPSSNLVRNMFLSGAARCGLDLVYWRQQCGHVRVKYGRTRFGRSRKEYAIYCTAPELMTRGRAGNEIGR